MFFDRPNELKAQSISTYSISSGWTATRTSSVVSPGHYELHHLKHSVHRSGTTEVSFIDEAWALLKNEASARYVAEAFRTYRKLGCAVVAVAGGERFSCRPWAGKPFFRTRQPNSSASRTETVSTLKEELKLSPEEVQLVSSVMTVPGVRSEFYLRTSWGSE